VEEITLKFTPEQFTNLRLFLSRVTLRGSEVDEFTKIARIVDAAALPETPKKNQPKQTHSKA